MHMQTLAASLDVTLAREAWQDTFGTDPAAQPDTVGAYVADQARYARRLLALLHAADPAAGAEVTLRETTVIPRPWQNGRGWLAVRVLLDVTLDVQAWQQRWGMPAQAALAPHLAAEVAGRAPILYQLRATVQAAPLAGGGRMFQPAPAIPTPPAPGLGDAHATG